MSERKNWIYRSFLSIQLSPGSCNSFSLDQAGGKKAGQEGLCFTFKLSKLGMALKAKSYMSTSQELFAVFIGIMLM